MRGPERDGEPKTESLDRGKKANDQTPVFVTKTPFKKTLDK
jgi:hypothetical protein